MVMIPEVPPELLLLILSNLQGHFEDLKSCGLVCRAWCRPSQIQLFRTVRIELFEDHGAPHAHRDDYITGFNDLLITSSHLVPFIKDLSISWRTKIYHTGEISTTIQLASLASILSVLTHLRSLTLSLRGKTRTYGLPVNVVWHTIPLYFRKAIMSALQSPSLTSLAISHVNFHDITGDLHQLLLPLAHLKRLSLNHVTSRPYGVHGATCVKDLPPLDGPRVTPRLEVLALELGWDGGNVSEWFCHPACSLDMSALRSLHIVQPPSPGDPGPCISNFLTMAGPSLEILHLDLLEGEGFISNEISLSTNSALRTLSLDFSRTSISPSQCPPLFVEHILSTLHPDTRLERLVLNVLISVPGGDGVSDVKNWDHSRWSDLAPYFSSPQLSSLRSKTTMAPHDDLLRSICNSEETLNDALAVLRLAQQKTAPGSGYELGPHRTGLPAISAYIASRRLNNNDVTRNNAQVASCLKASDFEKALFTVEAAIGGTRRSRGSKDIYETLIKTYAPTIDRQQFLDWMAAVNRALIQSDNKFNPEDTSEGPEVKYAIFFWTYNAATGKNLTTQQEFASEHHISLKILTKLLNKLTGCCTSVKARIQNDVKVKRSPAKPVAATPRRSPKKALRALPSRDSPTKRKLAEPLAEQTSDDEVSDALLPETPSKKRKADLSTKLSLPSLSPIKLVFPPVASSSRVTPDTHTIASGASAPPRRAAAVSHSPSQRDESVMDVDDGTDNHQRLPSLHEKSDMESLPLRRRFRPVYLDHKQWYGVDKRVKRIWKQAEQHRERMVELYGHPFESIRT
ncbi:hypothetical protein D9615_006679 [Tricholomella constricta]|uniref:F-box domain-containing protein n=1 Tax=Tricholomella constricta TaxID=117010 RepID=A0A8H5H708_9AGAR|nr:hypothetical protein D9615_006679 [Tricholomella constricta]